MIVDFELVKTDSAFHHRYRLYDRKNKLEYSDALEINVLEIPKVQKDETSPVSTWLRFFGAKTEDEFMSLAQTSPAMEEAWGVIKELSADERERLLAEDREKTRRDNAAYYETGLVEGRAEGLVEGREAGRMEGYASIITHMLAQGLSPEQISSFTGVTLSEVMALTAKKRKYD
jgi:predicted transposase/invertase (TIGR01784 family)